MPVLFGSLIFALILATLVWRSDFINNLSDKLSTPKSRSPEKLCKETTHALSDIDAKIEENKTKREALEQVNQDLKDFKEGVLISQKDEEDEEDEVVPVVEEITLFDKKLDSATSK